MTNGNDQVHEQTWIARADGVPELNTNPKALTKREYFAAIAMQGCLSNITQSYGKPNVNEASMQDSIKREYEFINDVAQKSVMYADALINALNKTK